MKRVFILILALLGYLSLFAQEEEKTAKFYLGASFGTSFSIGNFEDKDITNPDAGFAENGQKLDFYGGFFLNDKITLTGTFRHQVFETDISNIIDNYNALNPVANLTAESNNWETYYFLMGIAYKIGITKKFSLYPRIGLGPLMVSNPEIDASNPNRNISNRLTRSSETGIGLGYEIGVGLRTDLGKHFSLMPTFTFSGGVVTILDVDSTTDNRTVTRDYQPNIQSFNLGLSLAYRFY